MPESAPSFEPTLWPPDEPTAGLPVAYEELDDDRLAELARDDHAAFETLYHRHVTAVYRFCYARTNAVEDAEDLTTQTFVAALAAIDRYRRKSTFPGWLFGIARHKCADFHRKAYARPTVPWDDVAAVEAQTGPGPEALATHRDVLTCVERMLSQLSDDRREAVQLRYWGDLALADVARAMERSVAAVKMLISRGIADLRKRCVDEEA
jgi:RNA polymerase sigma-70 factor, ECF subfamily